MNKKLVFFTLFVGIVSVVSAQNPRKYTDNSNGWYMYFGDHKISSKWGVHLEAQWRRNEIITKPQQLLLRPGINYYFNKQAFATVGYCFVETYPYGEYAVKTQFPEHRIWEQIQVKNQIERFEVITRYRLEQRFILSPTLQNGVWEPGPSVYQNRFRLLTRVSVPFKGKTIEDESTYISAYDELWVSFGQQVQYNIFDQNRAYIALGHKFKGLGRVELGYMNQLLFKSDGIKVENNHTLQVSLISNIDFFKQK